MILNADYDIVEGELEIFRQEETNKILVSECQLANNDQYGIGFSFAHHGEIMQGEFYGKDKLFHRALITLPCSLFYSEAQFVPNPGNQFICSAPEKWKAIKAAKLVMNKFNCKYKEGTLVINSNIPVSWGLGSSTCDVITSIYAVANSNKIALSKNEVARLAIETEVASDSTMFSNEIILFAQREGIILEIFDCNFPPLIILGFNSDPDLKGVDTLSIPTIRYSDDERNTFSKLLSTFRIALKNQDPRLLAKVSTMSAIINQRYLPKPFFKEIKSIAENYCALGIQISHSGNVMGILFDGLQSIDKVGHAKKALKELGVKKTYVFKLP